MKLTKSQLKQLIKEELQNVLQEAESPLQKKMARKRRESQPRPPSGGEPGFESEGSMDLIRRSLDVHAAKMLAAQREGRELALDDIFAELQEIKALLSREMTPAGLGIEGTPQ